MATQVKATEMNVFKSEAGRQMILDYYDQLLARFTFQYQARYLDTSYGKTYILESGSPDQPPLLLFHGSSSNSAAWFADIGELARSFHVLAVDLIGDAGHSAPIRLNMHTDAYARWIDELLAGLGYERVSLMGNSLGAWMSLKFATIYPQKVDKLVLLAASGIAPVRLSFVLRLIGFQLRGHKGSDAIRQMVLGHDPIPEEVIAFMNLVADHYLPYTGEVPVFSNAELSQLTMPVLYIAGADDQLTNAPKSAARLQKLLPDVTIELRPKQGHVIYDVLSTVIPFMI